MTGVRVSENLEQVRERIAGACAAAGRDPDAVRLVAVCKRIPLPLVVDACRAGHWLFGENRIPDALDRQPEVAAALEAAGLGSARPEWHFIGHLQRNKAGRAVGRFALQHGVDSFKLAERLSRLADEQGGREQILLEVNISKEPQKHGFAPDEVADTAARIGELPGLELLGLMGMARFGADERELRGAFASLRSLVEKARRATGLPLPELSMGMSGDFEEAIAEGATIIRVGGAIFGPRQS